MKKCIVRLDAAERVRLEQLTRVGKSVDYRIRHANILLAVDESPAGAKMKNAAVAEAFGVSVRTVELLCDRLVEDGLDAALERKKQVRPSIEPMFDGEKEAKLIASACGPKPEGRVRWTLELLAGRAVALILPPSNSTSTFCRRRDDNLMVFVVQPVHTALPLCKIEKFCQPLDFTRCTVCAQVNTG